MEWRNDEQKRRTEFSQPHCEKNLKNVHTEKHLAQPQMEQAKGGGDRWASVHDRPLGEYCCSFPHLLLPSMITDSLLFASFPLFTLPTFLSPDLPPKTVSKIDPLLPCSTVPVRQHPPAIHTLVPYDFREVDLASFCNPSSLKVDLFPGKDAVCTRTSFLRSLFCSQLRDHILPSAHSCRRTQRKNIFKEKKKACDTRALKGLLGQYSFLVCCPLPNNPLLH